MTFSASEMLPVLSTCCACTNRFPDPRRKMWQASAVPSDVSLFACAVTGRAHSARRVG